jgi:hypothetical protein
LSLDGVLKQAISLHDVQRVEALDDAEKGKKDKKAKAKRTKAKKKKAKKRP